MNKQLLKCYRFTFANLKKRCVVLKTQAQRKHESDSGDNLSEVQCGAVCSFTSSQSPPIQIPCCQPHTTRFWGLEICTVGIIILSARPASQTETESWPQPPRFQIVSVKLFSVLGQLGYLKRIHTDIRWFLVGESGGCQAINPPPNFLYRFPLLF